MKISIGANLFEGPWGGGNLFVKNLSEHLLSNGHEVVFDLFSNDIVSKPLSLSYFILNKIVSNSSLSILIYCCGDSTG